MFKAATNLAYYWFRQRRCEAGTTTASWPALLETEMPAAEHIVVALEQAVAIVERTLLALPPRCRQVFLLRTSHEQSYEAIAQRLGVSKCTPSSVRCKPRSTRANENYEEVSCHEIGIRRAPAEIRRGSSQVRARRRRRPPPMPFTTWLAERVEN